MGNPYDPYREALVVETTIIWSDELGSVSPEDRTRIERHLLADPSQAADMQYVRLPTGFERRITVIPADLEHLSLPGMGSKTSKLNTSKS